MPEDIFDAAIGERLRLFLHFIEDRAGQFSGILTLYGACSPLTQQRLQTVLSVSNCFGHRIKIIFCSRIIQPPVEIHVHFRLYSDPSKKPVNFFSTICRSLSHSPILPLSNNSPVYEGRQTAFSVRINSGTLISEAVLLH